MFFCVLFLKFCAVYLPKLRTFLVLPSSGFPVSGAGAESVGPNEPHGHSLFIIEDIN